MNPILIALGALVALTLVRPLLVMLIARIFAGAIGQAALDRQSDEIHLERGKAQGWRKPAAPIAAAGELRASGFEDAGTWTVKEMPGVVLQLMAQSSEGFYGVVYEHPRAGHWLDVVTRFADGTSITFSSHAPTGLEPRPGHPIENLPGATATALVRHARTARPRRTPAVHSTDRAPADFMRAYAESIAWRKQKGVSTKEVVAVARKAA